MALGMTMHTPRSTAVHPCPWPTEALREIAHVINDLTTGPFGGPPSLHLVDPMAGSGSIYRLVDEAMLTDPRWTITATEIEPAFAACDPRVAVEDATIALRRTGRGQRAPDAIVTSPPYGNRMADAYIPPASDTSTRFTYAVSLGQVPVDGSAAALGWGPAYRGAMAAIYAAIASAASPDTIVIIDMADHVCDGVVESVTDWTSRHLQAIGLRQIQRLAYRTRRIRYHGLPVADSLLVYRGRRSAGDPIA